MVQRFVFVGRCHAIHRLDKHPRTWLHDFLKQPSTGRVSVGVKFVAGTRYVAHRVDDGNVTFRTRFQATQTQRAETDWLVLISDVCVRRSVPYVVERLASEHLSQHRRNRDRLSGRGPYEQVDRRDRRIENPYYDVHDRHKYRDNYGQQEWKNKDEYER